MTLLRERGVRGSDTALRNLANGLGKHALTIDLVGGYISLVLGGEFGDSIHDLLELVTTAEQNKVLVAICETINAAYSR